MPGKNQRKAKQKRAEKANQQARDIQDLIHKAAVDVLTTDISSM